MYTIKVSFASTSLVSSCKDIYVVPILTSVLYIREESKQIREEILLDTRVCISMLYIYTYLYDLIHTQTLIFAYVYVQI